MNYSYALLVVPKRAMFRQICVIHSGTSKALRGYVKALRAAGSNRDHDVPFL